MKLQQTDGTAVIKLRHIKNLTSKHKRMIR